MTKQQLKEKYTQWNINNGSKAMKRNNEIFHQMQELNHKNNNPVWCSMDDLLKDLMKTNDCNIALKLYAEYHSNEGKQESLTELALATNNFEIK